VSASCPSVFLASTGVLVISTPNRGGGHLMSHYRISTRCLALTTGAFWLFLSYQKLDAWRRGEITTRSLPVALAALELGIGILLVLPQTLVLGAVLSTCTSALFFAITCLPLKMVTFLSPGCHCFGKLASTVILRQVVSAGLLFMTALVLTAHRKQVQPIGQQT
jgi:hypothetical protein